MIKVINICKSYGSLKVLKGINMVISKGEIVAIAGASGAGKTTLLHIIGTLDNPDSGTLEINRMNTSSMSEKKLSVFRNRHIGFVFQFHHLLPEFTALENVCIPAYIAKVSKKDAERKAKDILDFLGMGGRLLHKPSQMSGGEQQRVAVARALINSPDVILADEPSGNLDSANAKELHNLFFNLREKFNQTFIIVTHNTEFAAMSDRIMLIKDGLIQV
ncbi:MAG: ABC transporter ATP-binding protein [Bacteroidales bacterium]|jgi:lipoprotein-releasing system ATP-binding protein|nr:ABC transporter ATP-binding protein [Bacteroidales bacterium]MDD4213884.1 ABC transporter ATP-binding protein [Bacteroidales bacterium]